MTFREAHKLRLYVNSTERHHGEALYLGIVKEALAEKCSGASVFPVVSSFGRERRIHDAASDYEFADLPVIIELVEQPASISVLLRRIGPKLGESLVTINKVREVNLSGTTEFPTSESSMSNESRLQRLTVYVGSSHTWKGDNLTLAILERCRLQGLAGATVIRGVMGFGRDSRIQRAHLLGLGDDLPEKVEIIDEPQQIAQFLPLLQEMIGGALVTLEDVQVIQAGKPLE